MWLENILAHAHGSAQIEYSRPKNGTTSMEMVNSIERQIVFQ